MQFRNQILGFYYLFYSSLPLRVKESLIKNILLLTAPSYFVSELFYSLKFRRIRFDRKIFQVDPEIGCQKVVMDKTLVGSCIVEANKLLSNYNSNKNLIENTNLKQYLLNIGSLSNGGIKQTDSIYKLFTNGAIINSVSDYLKFTPILYDITVFYSPKKSSNLNSRFSGSQLFHRDADDITVSKIWLLCDDIDEDSGPTVLLPFNKSEQVAKEIGYRSGRKIESDSIFDRYSSDLIFLTGQAGTAFVTDTVKCFHYGSRTSNEKGRLVIMAHFVTKYSDYVRPVLTFKRKVIERNVKLSKKTDLDKIILRSY